jgi:hypothetical protein
LNSHYEFDDRGRSFLKNFESEPACLTRRIQRIGHPILRVALS